ncbi:hypothetical protein JTB14_001089 [Gonioctena quinquepunctata]|nr:hypothetical protein JTB14_001089 [Gonioctena quinquepunctata]
MHNCSIMQPNHKSCVQMDITIFPTPPPPPPLIKRIPEKLLKIMRKYKFNWRLNQLSIPTKIQKKFVSEQVTPMEIPKVQPPKLEPELEYYSEQMARPNLRSLLLNKSMYGKVRGRAYRKKINKLIDKSRASIYNYYKRQARSRRLRQRKREATLKLKKSSHSKIWNRLATPKRPFVPQFPERKPKRIFTDYEHLDVLATPKPYVEPKVKSLAVNPAALRYQPTENIIRLAQAPERFRNVQKPLEPGKVERSALKYVVTPRIEAMAVPKQRSEKAKVDEDFDPWAINPIALKYKPTTRIAELAKPREIS